jgi:acetylglutamate kinase
VTALSGGAGKTHIVDGRQPHTVLMEIFTDAGIGTEVVKE